MASSMYSLYDGGGKLYAQGECKYVCDLLEVKRDAVHYAAKSGKKLKGYRIEAKPLDELKFALWDDENKVAEGNAKGICEYLRTHGAENYTVPNVYRSCYGKYIVADRFRITPSTVDMKRDSYRGKTKKQVDEIIWHLNVYGNTLICGRNKETILKLVKERKEIEYRKIEDGGKGYHYYVEVNR